jgi:hypothetical protein
MALGRHSGSGPAVLTHNEGPSCETLHSIAAA